MIRISYISLERMRSLQVSWTSPDSGYLVTDKRWLTKSGIPTDRLEKMIAPVESVRDSRSYPVPLIYAWGLHSSVKYQGRIPCKVSPSPDITDDA